MLKEKTLRELEALKELAEKQDNKINLSVILITLDNLKDELSEVLDYFEQNGITIAFRMSPEEANTLDEFVKLSGLTKQDYLIDRALQRDVKVQGNPRVYKALRNELMSLCDELKRVETVSQVNDDFLSVMNMALTILSCMNEVS